MESKNSGRSKGAFWSILFESILLQTGSTKNNKASAVESLFRKQTEADSWVQNFGT